MDWAAIGMPILQFLLPTLGAVLTTLAIWAIKKLLVKMGLEENAKIDAMIDHYVAIGVNHAEQMAKNYIDSKVELSSGDKLTLATSTVLRELKESGISDVGSDLIRARIEAYLNGISPKVMEPSLTEPSQT